MDTPGVIEWLRNWFISFVPRCVPIRFDSRLHGNGSVGDEARSNDKRTSSGRGRNGKKKEKTNGKVRSRRKEQSERRKGTEEKRKARTRDENFFYRLINSLSRRTGGWNDIEPRGKKITKLLSTKGEIWSFVPRNYLDFYLELSGMTRSRSTDSPCVVRPLRRGSAEK